MEELPFQESAGRLQMKKKPPITSLEIPHFLCMRAIKME
jgi:hypothetical protein